MKQQAFEAHHATLWQDVEKLLAGDTAQAEQFPARYRRLCQTLALAQQRGYSPSLTDYLQQLVLACHRQLYGVAVERPLVLREWLLFTFPQRVREEWRLLLLACLAFFGVALAVGILVWFAPHWAYSFASGEDLHQFQAMYQPNATAIGRGGAEGDFAMFGFYIWNNVSIGFRTFASGIFAGIPTLISLGSNGMHMGVIGSWLSLDPVTRPVFWSFVITHSSFEIIGLLLCGMAGMRLGLSLLQPGRLSRRHALMAASNRMFPVLVGAALMIVVAAFFEGFWSASPTISQDSKFVVGGSGWLLLIGYFLFAGRRSR